MRLELSMSRQPWKSLEKVVYSILAFVLTADEFAIGEIRKTMVITKRLLPVSRHGEAPATPAGKEKRPIYPPVLRNLLFWVRVV